MFTRVARRTSPDRPATPRERRVALLLAAVVVAFSTLFFPAAPVQAQPDSERVCGLSEWKTKYRECAKRLPEANDPCLDPPVPAAPDSGLAGWFASRTTASEKPHNPGVYIDYGYGGYDFYTYGLRCQTAGADPSIATENMIANWELQLAGGVIGAANAVREKAWDPGSLWAWADRLLERATETIYAKVFTGFGAVTLTIVGIYLIWRSRQADMSDSLTTAGWAVLVMLIVTAVAVYPVWAANLADGILTESLDVVHAAIGPREEKLAPEICRDDCADPRPPAERASEIATDAVLYRNWLRGTLGSEDSEVAQLYGMALYDAQAFSWEEIERIQKAEPKERQAVRDAIIKAKQDRFNRIAQQIKREDPEAYEHLQGKHGADRIGAGFIALISALFFGFFDLVASILVLLAFMIFRWAVIAAPLLGTFALLRPASSGLKRLGNAVVAAIFNIVIFGAGAAIYLLAVDVITSTRGLGGWLQVVLIGLCGLAAWILLRPYQRFTQLGGGSGGDGTRLRDRLLGRSTSEEDADGPRAATVLDFRSRPETRPDTPILLSRGVDTADPDDASPRREPTRGEAREVTVRAGSGGGAASRGAPPSRPETSEPDTEREVIAGNEVRIVRTETAAPGSRSISFSTSATYDDDLASDPPYAQPLYVPEEWRDEYANRT